MRRILAAIQEMALEMNSQDNARCELIREAYPYMDAFIDSRHQDPLRVPARNVARLYAA
jgi:hypothetical protein